jgi:predicted nucleic acid-binding protein
VTVFFDTNVLVYLFDRDEPAKAARSRELHEAYSDRRAVLSTQVLQEFYAIATRKLRSPLEERVALGALRDYAEFPLVVVTPPLVLAAAARSHEDRLSFWDSLIVEAAIEAKAEVLLSEDLQDGRMFGPLRVRNPFAPDFRVGG